MTEDTPLSPELALVDPELRAAAITELTAAPAAVRLVVAPVDESLPPAPRHLVARALALVVVRLVWVLVTVGIPLVAVIAALALIAAAR